MKNAEHTSDPGRRRRKLLLGVAAVGLLLAALVGFLLAPDGSADDSIRIHLEGTETNDMGGIIARFAVTNVGRTEIGIGNFFTEFKSNGAWLVLAVAEPDMPDVAPGEIALFTNQIPPEAKAWKVPFIWAEQPSRFQFIRARLKMKASSLFGGSASTNKVEFVLKLHTNYSAEFPR